MLSHKKPRYLTPQAIAERLDTTPRNVRYWCTCGLLIRGEKVRLAAIVIRNKYRIRRSALRDFLAATRYEAYDPSAVPAAPESPSRRLKRYAADKEAALKACRGEL